MRHAFVAAALLLVPVSASAAGANGPTCSEQRLSYCKAQGMDDNGFGPLWIHNHCKRSPFGPRFEYLVSTWQCMRQ